MTFSALRMKIALAISCLKSGRYSNGNANGTVPRTVYGARPWCPLSAAICMYAVLYTFASDPHRFYTFEGAEKSQDDSLHDTSLKYILL